MKRRNRRAACWPTPCTGTETVPRPYDFRYAWNRLKLLMAEWLVITVSDESADPRYNQQLFNLAHSMKDFRDAYYPLPFLRQKSR
jgi:hypothetical protein